MFGKVYGKYRAMIRVRIWFRCVGEGEIELQGYSEVWVMLMVTVRVPVQGQGLGFKLGVQYGVGGAHGYVLSWVHL